MQEVVLATATQTRDPGLAFRAATWHLTRRESDGYTTRLEVPVPESVEMSGHDAHVALMEVASRNRNGVDDDGQP